MVELRAFLYFLSSLFEATIRESPIGVSRLLCYAEVQSVPPGNRCPPETGATFLFSFLPDVPLRYRCEKGRALLRGSCCFIKLIPDP